MASGDFTIKPLVLDDEIVRILTNGKQSLAPRNSTNLIGNDLNLIFGSLV